MKPRANPIAAVQLAPGHAVLNLSGASGGVRYESTTVRDTARPRHGRRTEARVVKTIDNEGIVREIDALVKKVDDTIFRKLCVKMPFGHFLPATNLAALHAQVAELRDRVDALNAAAHAVGSAHRGRIGVLTPVLDVTDANLVATVRQAVVTALRDIFDVLVTGIVDDGDERSKLKAMMLRAKNIETLAVGDAGGVLRHALDHVRLAKADIRARIDGGTAADVAGRLVDLGPIETALRWFQVPA